MWCSNVIECIINIHEFPLPLNATSLLLYYLTFILMCEDDIYSIIF